MSFIEFWEITPFEFYLKVKAYDKKINLERDDKISIAYMTAWLHRIKRMPKLESLLGEKPKKKQSAEEMLNLIKQLNTALGGEVN